MFSRTSMNNSYIRNEFAGPFRRKKPNNCYMMFLKTSIWKTLELAIYRVYRSRIQVMQYSRYVLLTGTEPCTPENSSGQMKMPSPPRNTMKDPLSEYRVYGGRSRGLWASKIVSSNFTREFGRMTTSHRRRLLGDFDSSARNYGDGASQ